MEQERAYLEALQTVTSYRQEDAALTMFYPEGTLLFYRGIGP